MWSFLYLNYLDLLFFYILQRKWDVLENLGESINAFNLSVFILKDPLQQKLFRCRLVTHPYSSLGLRCNFKNITCVPF